MPATEHTYTQIWEMVRKIPKGKIATYGQIAFLCGLPGHARFVGYALHNLPEGVPVPWQRVINSRGRISFRKNTGNYRKQKSLLESEGVVFTNEKVDLHRFSWKKGNILSNIQ